MYVSEKKKYIIQELNPRPVKQSTSALANYTTMAF